MEIWKESCGVDMVCRRGILRPDDLTLLHYHENWELCQPQEWPCDFLVNGILYHGEPGDILIIGSRVMHRFLPGRKENRIRILQFPVRILLQSVTSGDTPKTHISKEEMDAIPGLYPAVSALLELMEQEPRVCIGQKNELLQSMMLSLYLLLAKHFPSQEQSGLRKDSDLFFRATEYANAHFTDDSITVGSMAKALYVSREKLSTVFSEYAGLSCKQYINALRVECANRLLLEGTDVSAASLKCGFGSIRTFNNVYKTIMGMSPTAYIKTHTRK